MRLINYLRLILYWKRQFSRRALRTVVSIFTVYTVSAANPVHADNKIILALGDSLTAGYGLRVSDSFPFRLQIALRKAGHKVQVINGGLSGDTTAGGLTRLDWLLDDKPDLVIVELGANDALRALDPKKVQENLDKIVRRIKAQGAHVLLTGMRAPPNMGGEYATKFRAIYPELARIHSLPLYEFFLEGVAANYSLNLPDGIHPNPKGVAVIVEGILPLVKKALKELQK
ncbi:MAG: arylesterase [Alphaproteobacteria bacterium]|nr:arylesterase [Alphaproteobacteria bacterium]